MDKAAKIVGSVYWRGGAHPSAKEFLLVQRIAEALAETRPPRDPLAYLRKRMPTRAIRDVLQMAEATHVHDDCNCEEKILTPVRDFLANLTFTEKPHA